MDKHINSVLQFKNYIVREMSFHLSPSFFYDEEEANLSINLTHDVHVIEDSRTAIVCLDCSIGSDDPEKPSPFTLHVLLEGQFLIHGPDEEKLSFDQLCNTNATAILYPYLRSTITDITKAANIAPFILPTINVKKFLEKKISNNPLSE